MDNSASQKKIISLLVVALVVIIAVWGGYSIYKNTRFHAVSTDPKTSGVSTISPFFKVNFNQELSDKNLSVSATPGLMLDYSVSGKTLTVDLGNSMQVGGQYSITVSSISSTSGQTISGKVFSFSPKLLLSAQLSKDQQNALLDKQDKNQDATDPIIGDLPHTTPDYTLSALISSDTSGKSQLTLQAVLYLSEADAADPASAQTTYKQEIRDYIQSLGLNPDNYTITYSIVQS